MLTFRGWFKIFQKNRLFRGRFGIANANKSPSRLVSSTVVIRDLVMLLYISLSFAIHSSHITNKSPKMLEFIRHAIQDIYIVQSNFLVSATSPWMEIYILQILTIMSYRLISTSTVYSFVAIKKVLNFFITLLITIYSATNLLCYDSIRLCYFLRSSIVAYW